MPDLDRVDAIEIRRMTGELVRREALPQPGSLEIPTGLLAGAYTASVFYGTLAIASFPILVEPPSEECPICGDYTALHGIERGGITYRMCRNCLSGLCIYAAAHGLPYALDRCELRSIEAQLVDPLDPKAQAQLDKERRWLSQ